MKKIILLLLFAFYSFNSFSQPRVILKEIAGKLNGLQTYKTQCSYTFSFPYGDPMTLNSQIVLKKVPSDTLCGFYYHFIMDENSGDKAHDFCTYFSNTVINSYKGKIKKLTKEDKPNAFRDLRTNGGLVPGIHHNNQLYFITPYQIAHQITKIVADESRNIYSIPDTVFKGKECMRFILAQGETILNNEIFDFDDFGVNSKYELWFNKENLLPVYYRRDHDGGEIKQYQYAWFYESVANTDIKPDYFTEQNLLPKNRNQKEQKLKPVNPGNLVGKDAPDWKLPVLNQDEYLSSNSFLGKYVLLEFTATWCGHCIEAAEMMNRLEERFKNNPKVALVSIFSSSIDKKEGIAKFAKDHKIKPVVVYSASEVGEAYQVASYPNFLIISPKGKVLMNFQGYNSTIESNIMNILTEFTE